METTKMGTSVPLAPWTALPVLKPVQTALAVILTVLNLFLSETSAPPVLPMLSSTVMIARPVLLLAPPAKAQLTAPAVSPVQRPFLIRKRSDVLLPVPAAHLKTTTPPALIVPFNVKHARELPATAQLVLVDSHSSKEIPACLSAPQDSSKMEVSANLVIQTV